MEISNKDQFFVKKPGGIKKGDFLKGTGEEDELLMIEGSKEKGPWYSASKCHDKQKLLTCIYNDWIEFIEKEVS